MKPFKYYPRSRLRHFLEIRRSEQRTREFIEEYEPKALRQFAFDIGYVASLQRSRPDFPFDKRIPLEVEDELGKMRGASDAIKLQCKYFPIDKDGIRGRWYDLWRYYRKSRQESAEHECASDSPLRFLMYLASIRRPDKYTYLP